MIAGQAWAFDPGSDVEVELAASATGIAQGDSIKIAAILRVPPDYHITSLETGLFYVRFDSIPGLTFGEPQFPDGKAWQGDEVYDGDVVVITTVTATPEIEPGDVTLTASVSYQICAETGNQQCFFPVEKNLSLTIAVLPPGAEPQPSNDDIFGEVELPKTMVAGGDSDLASSLESALARGSFVALLLVFVGGILTSLTPCVYPIIPITVSYIGSRAGGNKFRGFFLSIFFVLGLAIMYSTLGVIAAATGGVFGGITQHPAIYGVMILIFIAMGASMMGAFDLQLPASWQGKLQSGERKGVTGAVLMGMAAGLIAAPCVGPILVALLSWVAQTGSVVVGFGLLFTFSMGMGLLFIVIGTFAGVVTALPQAGGWMEGIKHFFGWLLWGTAVYFSKFLLPGSYNIIVWGAFISLLGVYAGAFRPAPEAAEWKWIFRKWFGILAIVAGIFLFLFGLTQLAGWQMPAGSTAAVSEQTAPEWIVNDIDEAFAKAAAEDKPVMMDFYADWCVACVELDHKTYNQPEVLLRSEKFVNLKLDFTEQTDGTKAITRRYDVKGMPTVIFFDSQGTELERFVGFKPAGGVIDIMDRVLAAN
jgi:thiol:disulfide interchange protein DsbD